MRNFEDTPLVSIVVPFFNIEECVNYCMESLLRQTYARYEVICIDDGSTDETGTLLDRYCQENQDVFVFHIPNSGLSAARNYGVSVAQGEYISFVDGDDVVSPYYIEFLMRGILEKRCDLAIGGHKRLKMSDCPFEGVKWSDETSIEVKNEHDAVEGFLYDAPMVSSWAHLTRREVYLTHPFPIGRVFEDTLAFGSHVMGFEKYAFCKEPIYGYVMRSGSITSAKNASIEKARALRAALDQFQEGIEGEFPDLKAACVYHRCLEFSRLLPRVHMLGEVSADREVLCQEVEAELKKSIWPAMGNSRATLFMKARLLFAALAPHLYVRVAALLSKWR